MPRRYVTAKAKGSSLADMVVVYGSAVAGGFAAYFLLYKTLGYGMIESVSMGTGGAVISIILLTTAQTILQGPAKNKDKNKMTDPLGNDFEWYR